MTAAHSSQAVTMSAQDNLACSKNVAYDAVSSPLRISSHDKVTCSGNIAYSTVNKTKEDSKRSTTTACTGVYDEVMLR